MFIWAVVVVLLTGVVTAEAQICMDYAPSASTDSIGQSGAVVKSYKWENGTTLRVKFLNGAQY